MFKVGKKGRPDSNHSWHPNKISQFQSDSPLRRQSRIFRDIPPEIDVSHGIGRIGSDECHAIVGNLRGHGN